VRHDGLVLVNSGAWQEGVRDAALTDAAFDDIPVIGPLVLTVGLLTFVFSTILGWSYYGEKAAEYLFGSRVIPFYRVLWVAAVMVGSVVTLEAVVVRRHRQRPDGGAQPTPSWR
jgi:AGCS family alanine or glycine:cation symporter